MTQGSQFQQPPYGGADQSKADVAKAQGQQVAEHAKDEAASVAQDAKREGQQVAETVKQEATQLADTAGTHAKRLMDQAKTELGGHAGEQQQRLAGGIRGLADELQTMVRSNDQSGPANDLAAQAAGKANELASWLETREPGDLLDDVRRFAARKPGLFLALAAGAGLLAGRLTRGLTADDETAQRAPSAAPQRLASTVPPVVEPGRERTPYDARHPYGDTGEPMPAMRTEDLTRGTAFTAQPGYAPVQDDYQPQPGFEGRAHHPMGQQPGMGTGSGQPDRDPRWSDAARSAPAEGEQGYRPEGGPR